MREYFLQVRSLVVQDWVEIMASAQQRAPDVPRRLWREVELVMRGWSVAQEAAGYTVDVDKVIVYARKLAALVRELP